MPERKIDLHTCMHPDLLEAGCDEAGRGPLAGPLFAAAVILPPDFHHRLLNDSKQMSEKNRDILRPIIEKEAVSWAVEEVGVDEIDSLNILQASVTGMQRAARKLCVKPEFLLVDGNRFRSFELCPYMTVVHGDALYANIAAASVLAKTYRDSRMRELSAEYPGYGWERNMGYPTAEHIMAIKRLGFTPLHRKSFHPKQLEPSLF